MRPSPGWAAIKITCRPNIVQHIMTIPPFFKKQILNKIYYLNKVGNIILTRFDSNNNLNIPTRLLVN